MNIHDSFYYQVTRLREYQGVDPHFDTIARQYHDVVKVKISVTMRRSNFISVGYLPGR